MVAWLPIGCIFAAITARRGAQTQKGARQTLIASSAPPARLCGGVA